MKALALACLLVLLLAGTAAAAPNVVVIETDDQTVADLQHMQRTKALLGAQGTTFDQSVVSLSQCCPSRATLLTGLYAHNHRVLTTQAPFGGFDAFEDSETLAVWLKRAGYRTAIVGKYLNQYGKDDPTYVPPGWDDWNVLLGPYVYRYFNYVVNENGALRHYRDEYQTDTLTRLSTDAIERAAQGDKPFFLWTAYVAPHVGTPAGGLGDVHGMATTVPSPLLTANFAGARLPKPLGFNEKDVSDKPLAIRRLPRIGRGRFGQIRQAWIQRQQALQSVDLGVARIVDTLKATGKLDDTVILFTSDNGFVEGQHRLPHGKVVPYEPSIRVPLLARGPGFPAGERRDQLVFNGDLAPTILDLAGGQAAWPADGESLLPLARDPQRRSDRAVVLEGPPVSKLDATPEFTGLRTPRYTYVEHATGEVELYDLRKDPGQLENLDAPLLRERLKRRLAELRDCRGAACRR